MGVPYAEVVGDPVAHSKSPAVHKFWLSKLGLEGDYRAVRVTAETLPDYLDSRRRDPDWRGCSVTLPLKEKVCGQLDETRLYAVKAVNCVVPEGDRLIGFNTDVDGIGDALTWGVDTGRPVGLIGAGGAAQAAVAALDILAVYQFHCIARDSARAWSVLEPYRSESRVFGFAEAGEALRDCTCAINATPLGMTGFPAMPRTVLDGLAAIRKDGFALDLVYDPLRTAFLTRAEEEGLQVIDGLTVLIGQAASAFSHFFGDPAPRHHDAELRERLAQ